MTRRPLTFWGKAWLIIAIALSCFWGGVLIVAIAWLVAS